jgi:hypothetical protein
MFADPSTRSRAQVWPRAAWPRRAAVSALATGLALLVAVPAGAQPAPPQAGPAAPPAPADAPAPAGASPGAPADASAGAPGDASPGAPADASAGAPAADTVGNVSTRRSWGWIAVGTAVAFATTSAMLARAVESREADIEFLIDFRAPVIGAPNRYEGQARGRYEELVDEAETLSKYAWITLGLAGAAALTATALFVLDGGVGAGDAPAARGDLTPAVTTGVVPGGMGVTLDWEF